MADWKDSLTDLQSLEEELLAAATRHNAARLRHLLSAEFEEVGASGQVFGREEIIADLAAEEPSGAILTLERFQAQWLAENLAQVRYRSRKRSATTDRCAERTSLWKRTESGWTLLYHQGTPVPPR